MRDDNAGVAIRQRDEGSRTKHEKMHLGSARVSRAGNGVPPLRTLRKIVSAGRRNRHARRVRYPDNCAFVIRYFPRSTLTLDVSSGLPAKKIIKIKKMLD